MGSSHTRSASIALPLFLELSMDGASTSGQQHAPGSMLSYFWQLIGWRQHQQVGSAGEDDAPPPKVGEPAGHQRGEWEWPGNYTKKG